MLGVLIVAIKIIVLLGFLILIHELGHFTVAKLCKVKVNEFAIGFGPTIWKKQGKETKYTLRLIPLGGFVSMEGEDEESDKEGSFSKASIPKRMAIVVAGATVNIIFAIIVYFILVSTSGTYISNEIDSTIDGYAAEEAGLQAGDKIVKVNDEEVKSKYDLDEIMEENNGEEVNVQIDRNGELLDFNIKPTEVKSQVTGIYLDDEAKIITMDKGSSAEKAGIQNNDKIIKVNGQDVNGSSEKVIEILNQSNEQNENQNQTENTSESQNEESQNDDENNNDTIEITVQRGNAEITIDLVPDTVSTYYLGINMRYAEDSFVNRCINGWMETKVFVFSIFDNLKQLFTGNVGLDQMMGPVGISEVVANTNGFREFFEMMALISLSLGVTNLLPIPALDGGKLLILLIEAIRRKPLKQQTEINIQLIGFAILISIFLLVTYNDILRIF